MTNKTDLELYFEYKCWQGLEERGLADKPEYRQRLEYEIGVIEQMKFPSYFLIVADFIGWAKRNDILVGGGRGSAAGSLVAYVLKITNGIDPLEHKLIFERFLNPSRISMPDIDVDFQKEKRDQVIQYIAETYGHDHVCQIGTVGTMKAKMTIQKVCKALGYPLAVGEGLRKLCLPPVHGKPQPLSVSVDQVKELKEYSKQLGVEGKILRWSEKFENRVASVGVHASGLVISDTPVHERVPLYIAKNESLTTQWEMKTIEEVGLIKFDILGLATLSKMRLCLDLIQSRHDKVIDINAIDTKDEATYQFLNKGELLGIFQLETSQGMRDLVMKVHPESINDLTAIVAIFRPGPLQSDGLKDYLAWRNGAPPTYLIPEFSKILNDTGGFCVFQDELIRTPTGSSKIQDLKNGEYVINGIGQIDRIKCVQKTGTKPVYAYECDGLITTRLTAEHRVQTITGYVPVREATHMLRRRYTCTRRTWPQITSDEAWLLGMCVGDGCMGSSSPTITIGERQHVPIVTNVLTSLFEGTCREYFHTRCWYVGLKRRKGSYCNRFNQWLKKMGVFKKTKKQKTLPVDVESWTDQELCALLAGLFDSDGCIAQEKISFCSNAPALREQIAHILDILKITFYFADNLHMEIRDKDLFSKLIGPYLKIKDTRQVRKSIAAGILVPHSMLVQLIDKYRGGMPVKVFCKQRGISSYMYWYNRNVLLSTILHHFPEERDLLIQTYLRGEIAVENIRKSEPLGEQDVFDLETESEAHSFIAGEAIVHNCVFQEQIMEIAQKCAGYTMAEADLLRKAMGKKKVEILEAEKEKFKTGWLKNKLSLDKFNVLWEQLLGFSDYAFNKCLSGDTIVDRGNVNQHHTPLTIKHLYNTRYNKSYWKENGLKPLHDKLRTYGFGKILAYDKDGQVRPRPIKDIYYNGPKKTYTISFSDGSSIRATKDHKFLSPNGYIKVDDFEVGVTLIYRDAGYTKDPKDCSPWGKGHNADIVTVSSITYYGIEDTYDIEMDTEEHNFIANGIVTSNSHAASYAFLSYQTAWLKTHYPVEFVTACMINDFDDPEQMIRYLGECTRIGIKVLPPDINQSQENFTIVDDRTVRFGLVPIRNIGDKPAREIITKRLHLPQGYQGLAHFCDCVNLGKVNKLKIESLIKTGAFDSFGDSRASLLNWVERFWEYRKELEAYNNKMNTWQKRNEAFVQRENAIKKGSKLKALKQWDMPTAPTMPTLTHIDELPSQQLQEDEHQHLGMFVSGHPLDNCATNMFDSISLAFDLPSGSQVTVLGIIVELKEHVVAKSKKKMAFLTIEDLTGRIKATVFPATFSKIEQYLKPLTPLIFQAKTDIFETDEGSKMGSLVIQGAEAVPVSTFVDMSSVYKFSLPASDINKLLHISDLFNPQGKHKMLLEVEYASGMLSRLKTPISVTKNKGELKKILDRTL